MRGADVFPASSTNLRASADPPRTSAAGRMRIDQVYEVFRRWPHQQRGAASLSGGEQRMALGAFSSTAAAADRQLSLGLAPLVVQRLIDVLRRLRDAGQAMLIVEQSLTVAAMLADRVVFVEKGAVRFDGPIAELTARDEFARAIFLGGAP